MLELTEYGKFLVALLVIVDPIGMVPMFILLSGSSAREVDRRRIARLASVAVAVVLVAAALIGESVLRLFGISLPSFKVAGAILIMLMAISMMQANPLKEKQTAEEAKEAEDKDSIAVVPLAVPLLAGPGAISTTIIYASERFALAHYALIIACCLIAALLTWLTLRAAIPMSHRMGKTGINVMVRLMGLLLAAVAVEIFVDGVRGLLNGAPAAY
jgi:multiple antibiotic resistance protein